MTKFIKHEILLYSIIMLTKNDAGCTKSIISIEKIVHLMIRFDKKMMEDDHQMSKTDNETLENDHANVEKWMKSRSFWSRWMSFSDLFMTKIGCKMMDLGYELDDFINLFDYYSKSKRSKKIYSWLEIVGICTMSDIQKIGNLNLDARNEEKIRSNIVKNWSKYDEKMSKFAEKDRFLSTDERKLAVNRRKFFMKMHENDELFEYFVDLTIENERKFREE